MPSRRRKSGKGRWGHLLRLTIREILAWADAHHGRAGKWPTIYSGTVLEAPDETWKNIHQAMQRGNRGLPGGTTLACLLEERRGRRHNLHLPRLTKKKILAWADARFDRTREWPQKSSGAIAGTTDETWLGVDAALRQGLRGLRGGLSLPILLQSKRGVRNISNLPKLSESRVLAWADSHHTRTGTWPAVASGKVVGQKDETWSAIDDALREGHRGHFGGSSLANLLERRRGVRNVNRPPRLTVRRIIVLADNHLRHTGDWPNSGSGRVLDVPTETWGSINAALVNGVRGLPGNESIARLLAKHRGKRNNKALPPLSEQQVSRWAVAHHRRTRKWPTQNDGFVLEQDAAGEKWSNINAALVRGHRNFPGGSSLAKFLDKHCRQD